MKKSVCVSIMLMLGILSGCSETPVPTHTDRTSEFVMPEGLKDCKVFRLDNGRHSYLNVVRCSDSVTTITPGKHTQSVTLVNE